MYRLLDPQSSETNLRIHRNDPIAVIDSESTSIAVTTTDGLLIYHNRAFAREHSLGTIALPVVNLCEFLPELWERCGRILDGQKIPNLRVIKLHSSDPNKPIGYLLLSANRCSCRQSLSNYYRMISENDNPNFLQHYSGLYVADPKAYTLRVNPSYEKIAFLPESEVLGRNLRELQEKGYFSQSVTLRVLEKLKHEPVRSVTIFQKIITGKEVLVTGMPIYDSEGRLSYVLTFVHDLLSLESIASRCDKLKLRVYNTKSGMNSETAPSQTRSSKQEPIPPLFDALPIVAKDPLSLATLRQIANASRYDSPVLLLGETGVGKDLFAKYLHHLQKKDVEIPFVTINCSAIPHELLESELFGYEEGAFSGARRGGKPGLFEEAQGGILFLNEISEMPLSLQAKLLTALDEGFIRRIGGNKARKVKTRIVCATNKDITNSIAQGTFRKDLYYRINVLTVHIPPLRDRPRDILPLIYHFVRKIAAEHGVVKHFSVEAQELLLSYSWPGNVRELRNLVERLIIFSTTDQISVADLPPEILNRQYIESGQNCSIAEKELPLKEAVRKYEFRLITQAINKYGSIPKAARALGIDPTTISRKLKHHS